MKLRNKFLYQTIILMLVLGLTGGATAFAAPGSGQEQINQAAPNTPVSDGIKIDLHHMLLESSDGTAVKVREVLKVTKTSGTKENKKEAAFKISLPEGYTNLNVEGISGNSYQTTPDGLSVTSQLGPGSTQITLFYQIPFTAGDLILSKAVNQPTNVLYVLSPKGQFRIKSEGLTDYGIQSLEGREYHVFLAEQPAPGLKFSLTINPDRINQGFSAGKSGFHSASHLQKWYDSPLASTNPHTWVAVIAILFFGIIAAIGYYLKKQRQIQKEKETEERLAGMLDDLIIRQKRMLTKINSLDQQNEAGEIDPEKFAILRKQYMDKLIKIKLKIKELEALEELG